MTSGNIYKIAGGAAAIFGAAMWAGAASADIVHLDDVIIDGSACIGFDCVNGESFGFDTIRIKENNLRIRAVDTSSTASFPTRDWQITFNDSSNGGQEKFSIDDIDGGRTPFTIEAGAPSHSLYVDDGGRLGLGTNTPVVDVHIKSGNTPTLRLEQDGSSGFAPQTWDVAGNEANFFIRDATNGSTLPFRIFPGAPSNALTIEESTGDVGIGTTSPDQAIDVERAGPTILRLNNTTQKGWDINSGGGGTLRLSDVGDTDVEFTIDDDTADVTCGISGCMFASSSDIRFKANVQNLTGASDIIRELRPIKWDRESDQTIHTGFGAHEVAAVMERHGLSNWGGHTYDKANDRHYLGYQALIAVLVGAHQEKDARIETLEAAVAELRAVK